MDLLLTILKEYGVGGLFLVVALYFIMKSRITIEYPRNEKKEH